MLKKYLSLILCALTMFMTGCKDEPSPKPDNGKQKKTILVYAINSNNLNSYLRHDIAEIKAGMSAVDTKGNTLLIYSIRMDNSGKPLNAVLERFVNIGSGVSVESVKEYNNGCHSTDKERISQVMADVQRLFPAEEYGLVFWSHSTAWLPATTWQDDQRRSFGQDYDGSKYHYCEVNDLADAIPSDFATFIWFDSCYMSNIETVYEFAGKCDYFVGSALELNAFGQPYDLTLPLLFADTPFSENIVPAAKMANDYYVSQNSAVAMSVMKMSEVENVASAATRLFRNFTPLHSNVISSLQCYSRRMNPPLYDFGQYCGKVAEQAGEDISMFEKSLEQFVIYKGKYKYDFDFRPIPDENYSGLTTHAYTSSDERGDRKYRTLKWYKRVYE